MKLNPVKGVRLEMAADVERLVLAAIDRLGPAGLGHELTVLEDDDCAFENLSGEVGLSAIRYAGYWARNARDLTPDELR